MAPNAPCSTRLKMTAISDAPVSLFSCLLRSLDAEVVDLTACSSVLTRKSRACAPGKKRPLRDSLSCRFNDGERTLGESRHPHPSLVGSCPHGTQSSGWIPAQPTVTE